MSRIAEKFDGKTYDAKRDQDALSVQLDHVRSFMSRNPGWHTLEEVAYAVGLRTGKKPSTASVSARLRDLRKIKFGGYDVRRRVRQGSQRLWEYHLAFPGEAAVKAPSTSLGCLTAILVAGIYFAFMLLPALADDSWINRGGYKNSAGEWCCGDYDCKAYSQVQSSAQGWVIDGEFIPYDEAMPIAPPDGQVTVCRRPDGTRRCVFGLKPGL